MSEVTLNQFEGSNIEKGFKNDIQKGESLGETGLIEKVAENFQKGLIGLDLFEKAIGDINTLGLSDASEGSTLEVKNVLLTKGEDGWELTKGKFVPFKKKDEEDDEDEEDEDVKKASVSADISLAEDDDEEDEDEEDETEKGDDAEDIADGGDSKDPEEAGMEDEGEEKGMKKGMKKNFLYEDTAAAAEPKKGGKGY